MEIMHTGVRVKGFNLNSHPLIQPHSLKNFQGELV